MKTGSWSGNSSSASPPPGEEVQAMDQRKRKRMQSNRESARRSRMRKQKHLDDLTAEVGEMSKENHQILNSINVTTQQCVKVEAENSVLRAQMMELSHRLQALNEILNNTTATAVAATTAVAAGSCMFEADDQFQIAEGFLNNCWNLMGANQQPIIAAAEIMYDCY